jgi:hypothetical protein
MIMLALLEAPIKSYLNARYGAPPDEARQYQFYRCELCHGLVTWKAIEKGGCPCGVGSRVRAAHLTLWEKVQLFVMPWRF